MGLILMILVPVFGTIQWRVAFKNDTEALKQEYTKPVYYLSYILYIFVWPIILMVELYKFLKKKLKEVIHDCTKHR